jgi:uncharacterized oxidoreductase
MKTSGNSILITGGSSGIGLALAQRFAAAGNEVIITGRRADALREAQHKHPGIRTIVSDVGVPQQREELARRVVSEFPRVNVLINNAGIQRRVDLGTPAPWAEVAQEIEINLGGPVHLSMLLVPHLVQQESPRIVNVSSALAFVPLVPMPIYCATKAAIHSFSQSLRYQLRETPIKVLEVVPPAVKTKLGGGHGFGEDVDAFADAIVEKLLTDTQEIGFGTSNDSLRASRDQLDQVFEGMNAGFAKITQGGRWATARRARHGTAARAHGGGAAAIGRDGPPQTSSTKR